MGSAMPDLGSALVYYAVFLFSTTLHEAAHAWAAKLGGDLTAYHGGQVSLDPRPHIRREPVGMVALPLITVLISGWPFGFASAPYDPRWALRHPRRAGWMALAGPGANLLIVFLAGLALRLGALAGVLYAPESVRFDRLAGATGGVELWTVVAFLLSVFFSLNLVLALLNLLPVPPLDGSAAVPLVLSDGAAARYQEFLMGSGRMLAFVGIYIAWQVFDLIFQPVFVLAASLIFPGVDYVVR
jgi:Zn-dependent protease